MKNNFQEMSVSELGDLLQCKFKEERRHRLVADNRRLQLKRSAFRLLPYYFVSEKPGHSYTWLKVPFSVPSNFERAIIDQESDCRKIRSLEEKHSRQLIERIALGPTPKNVISDPSTQ